MARAGINYDELIHRLKEHGIEESYKGISAKVNRGTFSFTFFMQCMKSLGETEIRLDLKKLRLEFYSRIMKIVTSKIWYWQVELIAVRLQAVAAHCWFYVGVFQVVTVLRLGENV